MLTEQKLKSFKGLLHESSRDEIIWMSGFLAGLSDKSNVRTVPPAVQEITVPAEKLTVSVLYGTETGNSKKISTKLAAALKQQGHKVKLTGLEQYQSSNLEKETVLLLVISTHGDGEPPAAAKKFYDFIHTEKLSLNNLKYAVLALGDSSYPLFCKAGEDVDNRLLQSGGKQILPVEKSDIDFTAVAEQWINNVLENLSTAKIVKPSNAATAVLKPKTGKQFYTGKITSHINLNDKGSAKETYHVEINSGDEINYLPGDSLGIIPANTGEDVYEILHLLSADENKNIPYKGNIYSIFELFKSKINILHLPQRIVQAYASLIKTELPDVRIDLKDLLSLYPLPKPVSTESLIAILEPITPRLYSISSSPSAHGNNEIHITVSRNKFSVNEKTKHGFCSNHIASFDIGDEFEFYIQPNNNFRLPAQDKDVIMIGPGTGIAPFRSFLFERDSEGNTGRNWLFFGDQHFATDFLYQTELLAFFDTALLTKLNTAFSRDQKEKLYVQHRMKQQSKELYQWLENGAHIYLCGCKDPMAKDVENTLIEIISSEGKLDITEAKEYINKLNDEGRFAKDVY